jgi:superfamily I DNA/RNA helicase
VAKLIGSEIIVDGQSNIGEDIVCQSLANAFDDSHIIYKNREVFGREFDVCILLPNIGIIVFEVKGWTESTIVRVENSDAIVIKTPDGVKKQNPKKQARGYRFAIERRIRNSINKEPLVFDMVCYPKISNKFFKDNRLDVISEEDFTLLKEDFVSPESLRKKIDKAILLSRYWANDSFNACTMFQVRNLFEADLELYGENTENEPKITEQEKLIPQYSAFYYFAVKETNVEPLILEIAEKYANGCKIYAVVNSDKLIIEIAKAVNNVLNAKRLLRKGLKLTLGLDESLNNILDENKIKTNKEFLCFNCSVFYINDIDKVATIPSFLVVDGKARQQEKDWMKLIGTCSDFNYEQYEIEHTPTEENILIRAGAGTGKTYAMISRVSFICYAQNISLSNLSQRIVMITFTNDAADNMKSRLKEQFQNYYLLTSKTEYLKLLSQIDNMQITTIHMYAKRIISLLGTEFGYGKNMSITSGEYTVKKIATELINSYIKEQKRYDPQYTEKLGMPIYLIIDNILNIISRLHNKSIDVSELRAESFGRANNEKAEALHGLLSHLIPVIEQKYSQQLLEENKIHLGTMMSILSKYTKSPKNRKRLAELKEGSPQFMFIDEFQDTDDVQIEALLQICDLLDYKMFVVGDIKQCIYRFRGAEEKAFDKLYKVSSRKWNEISLSKNYRSDKYLLEAYQQIFAQWGDSNGDLLAFDKVKDRIYSSKVFNKIPKGCRLPEDKYFRVIDIQEETDRMDALFNEVKRLEQRIKYEISEGEKLSEEERTIAILVRENWQADLIRQEGSKRAYNIITNTGGVLYQSEPALDMLMLVNALVHYDEADYLYGLVKSNFFDIQVSKTKLYNLKMDQRAAWRQQGRVDNKKQAKYLIEENLNLLLSQGKLTWDSVVSSLRIKPILQILRELYTVLRPWRNYSSDEWAQRYYRLNVDLLFEEIIAACNMNHLTVNTLAEFLFLNIVTGKKVEERMPPLPEDCAEKIRIKCITVHKSKGLEYGHVILPFASFRIDKMKNADLHVSANQSKIGYSIKLPGITERLENSEYSHSIEAIERSKEETRVLYVAMTRAIRSFSYINLQNAKGLNWQSLIQRRVSDAL